MNNRIYYSREAEMQAQRERLALAVVVAALSVSMGAIMALLFAPQRGIEIRRTLGEQVEQVVENGRHAVANLQNN